MAAVTVVARCAARRSAVHALIAGRRWADLMRRAFDVDVLACPRCGGRLRLVALLEAGAVTARILRHLGLPAEIPAAGPARAPPLASDDASW